MAVDIPVRQPRNIFETMTGNESVLNALTKQNLENKYYAPNIQSEINKRIAETKGIDITNQYLPEKLRLANELSGQQLQWNPKIWQSEIGLRGAQAGLAGSESNKINYMLQHPGFFGDETAKQIQYLMDIGAIDKNSLSKNFGQNGNAGINNNINTTPAAIGSQTENLPIGTAAATQPLPGNITPFHTGNAMVDAILNKPYANMAYQQKMTQGFNWTHLPVETKSQLIAQGYGMGIDPLKMMDYVNNGMGLKDIARAEGLDPENLPPPIYAPTTATKTRVQQVEQVGRELDYLSSATTPIIKQYADTFMNVSPARIMDMLSNNVEAQKRFGEYIGALSVQTGLASGRVLLEGGRPGLEVMRMVKDSALKGIDQNSPIKMSGIAYESAQKKIDEILQRGAKIRTTTGMNPMSEIGKSRSKSENNKSKKPASQMTTEEIKKELALLRGAK